MNTLVMMVLFLMMLALFAWKNERGKNALVRRRPFSFDVQRFATDLPDNPSTSSATVGKDYLLAVNTGTIATPIWTLIGGQRGASKKQKAEEIDVSHKTSGGWGATHAGMKSWSIDLDALKLVQDKGVKALDRAFAQSKEINIKLGYTGGSFQVGWGTLTDYSSDFPHDGEASVSGTISGNGPISNESETFSIANGTDLTFYFEKNALAESVTKGGTIVAAANYTATTKGEITFESTYLSGLPVGEHLFYANLDIGGFALIAITVIA